MLAVRAVYAHHKVSTSLLMLLIGA